jgi:hypothetical protein
MGTNGGVLVGAALAASSALAAFAAYGRRQRRRVRAVTESFAWFSYGRHGGPRDELRVNCTDDPPWPLLVSFDDPRTGMRHRTQSS